jgi:hypothetical protein
MSNDVVGDLREKGGRMTDALIEKLMAEIRPFDTFTTLDYAMGWCDGIERAIEIVSQHQRPPVSLDAVMTNYTDFKENSLIRSTIKAVLEAAGVVYVD